MSIRTTIPTPYAGVPVRDLAALQVYIDPKHHQFFSRGVCSGTPGALNAIVATLFKSFYDECQRRKIEPKWTPDGEQHIITVLAALSFRPAPTKRTSSRRTSSPPAVPST